MGPPPYGIKKGRTSYYANISKTPEEAEIKMAEDRKRLAGNADPGKKGMRGRKAVGKIEKEFDSTHISQYAEDRKT